DGKDGKDGITPEFKIENGDWYVSTDNGQTWQYLGRATGADGKDGQDGKDGINGTDGKDGQNGADGKDGQNGVDGDSMFSSIDTSDPDFVIFTLADGTQIKLPTWYAFEALKQACQQMNANIQSLQTIVDAMQSGDYIVSYSPLVENGKQTGYTITFAKGGSIIIYNGKDGKDGVNGADGKDGQNGADGKDGKDGYTPSISVRQDTDGRYYWTLDGEWLLDDNGKKILAEGTPGRDGQDGQNGANGSDGENGKDGQNGQNGADGKDGKDGVTPQLKIEDGYWFISYDNGSSWTKLGQATGADGKDGQDGTNGTDGKDGADGKDGKDGMSGDSMFTNIETTNPDYIIFTLADGTQIKLPTWYAFEALKLACQQMNANIQSLQTIIDAMQSGDYIVSYTPLMENGKQVGYTITFAKGGSIILYNGKDGVNGSDGKDGQNGQNGADGKDGVDGKDGYTPSISVKQDTDGIYYWTVDGEWLKDDKGNKVPVTGRDGADGSDGKDGVNGSDGKDGQNGQNGADGKDGKDGITPQLKIEDGNWFISYDNGSSWTKLGRATGDNGKDGTNGTDGKDGANGKDGKDGDSVFSSVREDDNYVYVTLASSGEEIAIPKTKPFSISFDSEEFTVQPGQTYSLKYIIKGGDAKTQINFYEKNGLKAELTKTSNTTGILEVTTPTSMAPKSVHELIVMVNDGYDRTLMQTLTFIKGVGRVTNYTAIANNDDTRVNVTLTTNLNGYKVEIPDEAKSWLSLAPASRATMRDDLISFSVNTNDNTEDRSAVVKVLDMGGIEVENIYVLQHGTVSKTVNVETAGKLSTLIDASEKTSIRYLFLSGTLNNNDFTFIGGMTNLKYLDLSEISNTSLPKGDNSNTPGMKGNYETFIFPNNLNSIPEYCFANRSTLKGDLIIPDGVTSIGKYAFYNCVNLLGNLIIGESVENIDDSAFAMDGTIDYVQKLYFSRIYCKAVNPPGIRFVRTNSGRYSSSFGDPSNVGCFPDFVGIPKGCKNTYMDSKWNIFQTIEEVDFDKLGY
ncbi:MAG: leucine-rich repeat protein, partial [Bacteroides sp.]|nr:leucine-rich repeat protein [Bacteroides sp.]